MILRNTRESWGGVAKTLHWSAAALVLAMLGLGLNTLIGLTDICIFSAPSVAS